MSKYKQSSLSLTNAIATGSVVMIGGGIFALLGQVAELSGEYFAYAFILGGIISGFSAYSYIKMANAYPSVGGISMFLQKAYGKRTTTAFAVLLIVLSMILGKSLLARTFGVYTLQLFNVDEGSFLVPMLAVGLLVAAFIINILVNKVSGKTAIVTAAIKIGGILIFAIGAVWAADFRLQPVTPWAAPQKDIPEYLSALALAILAYKGFATLLITGREINHPHKNVGRGILISLLVCAVVYSLTAFAVGASLSVPQIIDAKDYAIAEGARSIFGKFGLWFTVGIAIVATVSGVIFSIFASSRITAMLTNMKPIRHNNPKMPGNVQQYMLVLIVVLSIILTVAFDLTGIAVIGAILYLVVDIIVHLGILRHLKEKMVPDPYLVISAIILESLLLVGLLWVKVQTAPGAVIVSVVLMVLTLFAKRFFLRKTKQPDRS